MKKSFLMLLSVILSAALLSGCNTGQSDAASGTETAAVEQANESATDAEEPVDESEAASTEAVSEKTSLKIGTSSVSIDLAESGVEALEKMGYEVEIVVFDNYFVPNTALVEGSLDANFYQHLSFMEQFNADKDTDIIMLEPKMYEFYGGLYSVKADSVENLPDGGIVGIATDASNIDRDMKNLASQGIITLTEKPQSGELYTILDIVDNSHNYEFVQSDHTKYTNMDEYACLLGTSNTMAAAGVNPTENLLAKFPEPENALGFCILPENENEQWVKDMMTAYTSDEAAAKVAPKSGFQPSFE